MGEPEVGAVVNETGWLLRDGGGFLLRRDAGGSFRLVLLRVPVDHVEKHVRIHGVFGGDGVVEVDGVAPA